jgi:hypothetical protein
MPSALGGRCQDFRSRMREELSGAATLMGLAANTNERADNPPGRAAPVVPRRNAGLATIIAL